MTAKAPVVRNVVRLSLLEQVSPTYLLRFLQPFAEYLAGRGVLLAGAEVDHEWIGRLHQVLNAVDPEMPSKLEQALLDVADLASDEAHEQIVQLAGERQLSLFSPGREMSACDLAFKLYLEHGELFTASHARVQSREARLFVEFHAAARAPMEGHDSEAKRIVLQDQLARWFGDRNCTDYCEVRVSETDDEVTFLVIHGRTPRSFGVITTDRTRGRASLIPDKQDTLVFDKESCRLSVNARWPAEQDFYRRAVGRVFFDDPEHFKAHEVYTGDPIVEVGERALSPRGILGLLDVRLTRIEVRDGSKPPETLHWSGRDLGPRLGSVKARALLDGNEITRLKLALGIEGRRWRLPVTITPPNKLDYDRRFGEAIVREFLLVRGFMRLPARQERRRAALG